jgi:ubiquinone/menaquinone biosynthesis C-methylase UbiE
VDIVQEMESYYGKRAPLYDTSMGYDNEETVVSLTPVIRRMQELLRGRRVLEIACGPCFWTRHVSGVALSVAATDYNESTLEQARRKALDRDKVTLQRADACLLSQVQGEFDAALAVDWFAHVPRSRFDLFLQGLHRRLQPGSLVVFCDQLPGPESITGSYDQEGNHLQTRELPDGTKFRVIKHFLSERETRDLFSRYSDAIEIASYPHCRRGGVSYTVARKAA